MFTRKYPATQWPSLNPRRSALVARLVITVVTSSIVSSAALAADPPTSDGYRFVGGEIGYVSEGGTVAGRSTSEQVRQDHQRFRRNPVMSDGYRFVGGEAGYVYEGAAPSALGSGTGAAVGGLTRAQVLLELMKFQKNPVSADGQWRYIGGEQGWVLR